MNCRPLELEATALPTAPQPLPTIFNLLSNSFSQYFIFIHSFILLLYILASIQCIVHKYIQYIVSYILVSHSLYCTYLHSFNVSYKLASHTPCLYFFLFLFMRPHSLIFLLSYFYCQRMMHPIISWTMVQLSGEFRGRVHFDSSDTFLEQLTIR